MRLDKWIKNELFRRTRCLPELPFIWNWPRLPHPNSPPKYDLSQNWPSGAQLLQTACLQNRQACVCVWLRLLHIDKSLTPVSGTQAASVGWPLDIWQADGALSPPVATSENMPPRHQTVAKSGSCWQRDTGAAVATSWFVQGTVAQGDFAKNVFFHRGYEVNVT